MSGQGYNTYMYGGDSANPLNVTDGGNVGTTTVYAKMYTVGKVLLSNTTPYQLPDCPCVFVEITSDPLNGYIWYAGVAEHAPQIGAGIPIVPNAYVRLPCTNSNQISLIATNNGDNVFINIAGTTANVPITPANPASLDRTPPHIILSLPANGSTEVSPNVPISLQSDEAMDPLSVNPTTITVSPPILDLVITQTDPFNIILTHASDLPFDTTYTVTVLGIKDAVGNALMTPFISSFTTAVFVDTTPPTVLSSYPADGSTAIPTSAIPVITFSEPVAPSSIDPINVEILDINTGDVLLGTFFSFSTDGTQITIGGTIFNNSGSYQINVTDVTDLAGNVMTSAYTAAFTTTVAVDSTQPTVLGSIPAGLTTNVPLTTVPTVTFSEGVAPGSITSITVAFTNVTTGVTMSPTLSLNATYTVLSLNGLALDYSTEYRIDIFGFGQVVFVTDLAGNALNTTYSIPFTTIAAADSQNPTVVSTVPVALSTTVLPSTVPTITFSEAMNTSSATVSSIQVVNVSTGTPLSGLLFTWSSDSTTVTINNCVMTAGTQYRIDIYGQGAASFLSDIAGNPLNQTVSVPFTTQINYTTRYNVVGNSYINLGFWAGGAVYACEFIATGSSLIGKIPVYFTFVLRAIGGGLAGTVSFKWRRKDSHGNVADFITLGTVAASTVPVNTDTTYTFNLPSNTTAIKAGDSFGITWESGNASFHLQTRYSTTNVFDTTKTFYSEILYNASGDVNQDITGADFAMTMGCSN